MLWQIKNGEQTGMKPGGHAPKLVTISFIFYADFAFQENSGMLVEKGVQILYISVHRSHVLIHPCD